MVSFATARTLNAVISVVQGTQVELQPGGVGMTFTPGQVLDPINDLVEQFSLLMLAASVSFGVQLALIKFGAFWAVSSMLSVVALAWTWSTWPPTTGEGVVDPVFAGAAAGALRHAVDCPRQRGRISIVP